MPHPTPALAETWGPEGIYIYIYTYTHIYIYICVYPIIEIIYYSTMQINMSPGDMPVLANVNARSKGR